MVIRYLNVECIYADPSETDPVLVIDANGAVATGFPGGEKRH
jgi:hypothetical protein